METIDLKHENESDVKAITDTDFIENYIPSYNDLYNGKIELIQAQQGELDPEKGYVNVTKY